MKPIDWTTEPHASQTFRMLESETVENLKPLAATLHAALKEMHMVPPGLGLDLPESPSKLPTRKAELAGWIAKALADEPFVKAYYGRLSPLEQSAVQEAVHSKDKALDGSRFHAKYGEMPRTYYSRYSYRRDDEDNSFPPLKVFFIDGSRLPEELASLLKTFVPRPKETKPLFQERLPESIEIFEGEESVPLIQHRTEQAAIQDLAAVLQLVGMGKVAVGAKTGRLSKSGAGVVRKVLSQGDFYTPETEADGEYEQVRIGPAGIRPFAWNALLQAGNLVRAAGNRLELTRSGKAALSKEPHDVLASLWERWLKTKLLHELNRIETIKGQKSKKHPLAPAEPARRAIAQVLSEMEEGKWVRIDDFLRFLIATGRKFDVVRNDWALYIGDPQYGALGYSHVSWTHVNGRFALAFLLEYAATLGIIDVAIVPPWDATSDHTGLWGTDEMSCLSRYDGLWALRLNSLGAWFHGKRKHYAPSFFDDPSLSVLPNLEVTVTGPAFPPADALFLDQVGERVSDRVWRMSLPKLLQAAEQGVDIGQIGSFLKERNKGDLPQPVCVLFEDARERIRKVQNLGDARLLECADSPLAHLIVNDSKLRNLCILAGERHLVILKENEDAFRKALRDLGYIVGT